MPDIAILKTGGKQYIVKAGDTLKVEKLTTDQKRLEFPDLLAGKKITATIKSEGKAKKIMVIKFKAKTTYRRRAGHRQPYTELAIEKIS